MNGESPMRRSLALAGCTPVPLAGYLKALGTLRIVAEQADPGVRAFWADDHLVLATRLAREELERLLLERYRPTPIVAPWNGGSGFYARDNQSGIGAIEGSRCDRLGEYREILAACRGLLDELRLTQRPAGEDKTQLLVRLRSCLAESALPWLDAAVVLTSEGAGFPPLLGTGGNDGRLDFTNNFMQRLSELIDPETGNPWAEAAGWLRAALFADTVPGLTSSAIGQFAPGDAGGPNATTGFEGDSRINPWDFVLMLEGAVLFAAASTRRLDSTSPTTLSFPFTVRPVGGGSGCAALGDEGDARGEIWLPIWERPAGLAELTALLAEGRATVRRRAARDGLDFARAVAGLGVDRGVTAFERYAFMMRSGRSYLAAPLGRVPVRSEPLAELADELEAGGYLERLRRFGRRREAPGSIRRQLHRLEAGLFELARHGGRRRLQEVMGTLGELQQIVGVSPAAREEVPPMPLLRSRWVGEADDGSHEFRIAAALAGLEPPSLPMRCHLTAVSPGERRPTWAPDGRLTVWAPDDLVSNLLRALERRLLEAERLGLGDKPLEGRPAADLAAVAAFLRRRTDDRRIARLLAGLAFVRPPAELARRGTSAISVPAAFSVLRPLFTRNGLLRYLELVPQDGSLSLSGAVVARLRAERVDEAIEMAWRALRATGAPVVRHPSRPPRCAGLSGRRLAAAALIPLEPGAIAAVARRLHAPDGDPIAPPRPDYDPDGSNKEGATR